MCFQVARDIVVIKTSFDELRRASQSVLVDPSADEYTQRASTRRALSEEAGDISGFVSALDGGDVCT